MVEPAKAEGKKTEHKHAGGGARARPHLIAAAVTLILFVAGAFGAHFYFEQLAQEYVNALAPLEFQQKEQGSLLQRAAFRQADLLPIYGSSELDQEDFSGEYHGSKLFRTYPTGFTIFPIGRGGTGCLILLQDLASIGPDLRGKKVAISMSPPWFIRPGAEQVLHDLYLGNYSHLTANALVFSTDISYGLKSAAAKQMLVYPDSMESDPLLITAARALARDSLPNRAIYAVLLPLGKLRDFTFDLQDGMEIWLFLRSHPEITPAVSKQPKPIDWQALISKASDEAQANAARNPFGFDDAFWKQRGTRMLAAYKRSDKEFIQTVNGQSEWRNCKLLFDALKEFGAHPFVLSQPIKGAYFKYLGVSYNARKQYYLKMRDLIKKYDLPLMDFAEHDDDLFFVVDPYSHLSRKGWAFYSQALDEFYHNQLPEQ